ncbi:MAG: hypothetical protein AAF543_01100 [Pseudomonadota bacterium]
MLQPAPGATSLGATHDFLEKLIDTLSLSIETAKRQGDIVKQVRDLEEAFAVLAFVSSHSDIDNASMKSATKSKAQRPKEFNPEFN